MPYQPFSATTQMADADAVVDVIAITPRGNNLLVMCIIAPTGPIYITREQAMEFFGLVRPRIEIHYPLRRITGNNDDQES